MWYKTGLKNAFIQMILPLSGNDKLFYGLGENTKFILNSK